MSRRRLTSPNTRGTLFRYLVPLRLRQQMFVQNIEQQLQQRKQQQQQKQQRKQQENNNKEKQGKKKQRRKDNDGSGKDNKYGEFNNNGNYNSGDYNNNNTEKAIKGHNNLQSRLLRRK